MLALTLTKCSNEFTSSIIIITYRNKKSKLRMDRRKKKNVKTKMFLMAKRNER